MPDTTGNTQTTTLTPNSNCKAVGSGDSNMNTTIMFQAPPNGVAWYTTSVSTGNRSTELAANQGNDLVTFMAGLTCTLTQIGGGAYNITVTGKILDNDSIYNLKGTVVYMSTGAKSEAPETERRKKSTS
jgi:hypothetical protein